MRDQNAPIMQLSQQSPTLSIEGAGPESSARSVNAQDPKGEPRSKWVIVRPVAGGS
jgi:hypothetical protein